MKIRHYIDLWLLAGAGLGLMAAFSLFSKTYPQASLQGTPGGAAKSHDEILRLSETILDRINVSREGLEPIVDFRINHELMAFGQVNFGTAEANRLFAAGVPAFFWNVRYGKPSLLKTLFDSGSEEQVEKALEKHILGEVRLQFDLHGRLLSLEINDETASDTLGLQAKEAQALAFSLLPFSIPPDTSNFVLEKSQVTQQRERTDYALTWQVPAPAVGLKAHLEAVIRGARLQQWQLRYTPMVAAHHSNRLYQGIGELIAGLFMIALVSIYFIKKLRADEISLKAGLPAAIVAALGCEMMLMTDTTKTFIGLLVPIILAPGFLILAFVILYGTGESLMRNLGQDRLLSFEAAQHGQWRFRRFGESLWRGAALGLILFGAATLILNRLGPLAKSYFNPESNTLIYYTATAAPLTVIGENLCYTLFAETAYRLLLISALARFFRSNWIIAGIVAIVSAMGRIHFIELAPFDFHFGINILFGLALAWIYLRFDFLTTVIAALTVPLLMHGFSFLHAGKIVNALNGWAILALPVMFIIGGQLIRRFGRREIDLRALQPDYIERLAEKERMKRELEIARQVQLSFLPRQLPTLHGLDIAALCLPANEVGGDYYDFLDFGNGRLGVVIGDVSGKGISAAFYMTLTKGIIKSSVQDGLSPAQVLTRANQIFYDNVERGIFVSLIYGVLDLPNRDFTFARAGHNPILFLQRQQQNAMLVSPQGLALGLERGALFARNIQEQKLVITNGDVLVFYTDGFTEAMNRRQDEFGESRMMEILSNGAGASSHETITQIRQAVQRFIGSAPQHDDMTMVVVKVL